MGTRRIVLVASLVLLGVIGVAVAIAATGSHGHGGTEKAAANTTFGSLLVSSSGMTLYHLTTEKPGSIGCTGSCATYWPPLVLDSGAEVKAGSGTTASKLGTIRRPDGRLQVTYGGIALYRYSLDTKAGDVKGQGSQGIWYALTPAGTQAKAGTVPATTTTMNSGGGYGYGN